MGGGRGGLAAGAVGAAGGHWLAAPCQSLLRCPQQLPLQRRTCEGRAAREGEGGRTNYLVHLQGSAVCVSLLNLLCTVCALCMLLSAALFAVHWAVSAALSQHWAHAAPHCQQLLKNYSIFNGGSTSRIQGLPPVQGQG